MKGKSDVKRIKFLKLATCYLLLVTFIGCEAFVRKFTRKPKQENEPQDEMVVAPEEYKVLVVSKEEQYRQYFLFWKSWHDELIQSFFSTTNRKKYISCADEAIENLSQIHPLLKPEKQTRLDAYLLRLKQLRDAIINDVYGQNSNAHRDEAETIKRGILRYFSYSQVKDYLE